MESINTAISLLSSYVHWPKLLHSEQLLASFGAHR